MHAFSCRQTLIPCLSEDGMHNVYQAKDSCVGCNPVCTVLNDCTLGLIIGSVRHHLSAAAQNKDLLEGFAVLRLTSGGRDSRAGLGQNKGGLILLLLAICLLAFIWH